LSQITTFSRLTTKAFLSDQSELVLAKTLLSLHLPLTLNLVFTTAIVIRSKERPSRRPRLIPGTQLTQTKLKFMTKKLMPNRCESRFSNNTETGLMKMNLILMTRGEM